MTAGVVLINLVLASCLLLGVQSADLEKLKNTPDLLKLRGLVEAADFTRAESEARSMLAGLEAAGGGESIQMAWILETLAEILRREGRMTDREMLRISERAVVIKEKVLGPDHSEVAESLGNLGNSRRFAGDPAGAIVAHERALRIQERLFGPEDLAVAGTLSNLGIVLMDQGKLEASREKLDRALSIREKMLSHDHLDLAVNYSSLAALLRNMGEFGRARKLNERALAIREKALPPGHPDIAYSLNLQGDILHRTGDYAGARSCYERALEMRESATPPDPFRLSEVIGNLGDLERDLGDYAGARALYERVLALRRQAVGEEHFFVGYAHTALGALLKLMGEYEAARTHDEIGLRIIEKTMGPEHPMTVMALLDLADLLYETGDLAAARLCYERSIGVWEGMKLSGHPYLAWSLNGLANILRDRGDHAAAKPLYERALGIRRIALGPAHPQVGQTLIDLARLQASSGDVAGALETAGQGEAIIRRHLQATERSLPEQEALRSEAVRLSGLDLALRILTRPHPSSALPPEASRRVWEQVVLSRALVLDEMATRHRTSLENGTPDVAALVRELSEARNRYARLVVQGPDPGNTDRYRTALEDAREQMEGAERSVAEKNAVFRKERQGRESGAEEIAAALPAGASLVSYIVYSGEERPGRSRTDRYYAALVLRAGQRTPAVVPLGPGPEIESLIGRWKNEAAQAPRDSSALARYREAGGSLRRAIWDPVARQVAGSRQLFIVPDGAIHTVSLGTLPDGSDRYLVESEPLLHYLSAERDLVQAGRRGSAGRGLLILGGPDFDSRNADDGSGVREPGGAGGAPRRGSTSNCEGFRSLRFASLPGSGAEAAEVERLWLGGDGGAASRGEVLKLTGSHASEAAFKKNASGHRVLHLATHGFTLQDRCETGGAGSGRETFSPENPLLLAGLALAGANKRYEAVPGPDEEDGILTAEEIASLDLRGVEWAVLSACETGLGPVQTGEGVLGLRRAFEVAGAGTLIMSLWPVTDNDALAWIRRLYTGRLEGMTTAEAVRAAAVQMIEARRRAGAATHPYYWGAFVAAGDWN